MTQRICDRERQYALDAITCEYATAYHAWQQDKRQPRPDITAYMARYPQFALELAEYALWLAVSEPLEPFVESETLELSPAGKRALADIRAQGEREKGGA